MQLLRDYSIYDCIETFAYWQRPIWEGDQELKKRSVLEEST
jgi:hypothetical protein